MPLYLSEGAFEQVFHVEVARPSTQVREVERVGLDRDHAEDVLPLALRDAPAQAKPLQLVEDDVLGRGEQGSGAGS